MKRKAVYLAGLLGLVLLFIIGCGSNEGAANKTADNGNDTKPPEISTEPVTLTFMVAYGGLSEKDFNAYFGDQVKKKYPNITIEFLKQQGLDNLQQLVAAKQIPDIIQSGLPGIPDIQELHIIEDLNPYMKRFGADMAQYDPVITENISRFSSKGELIALPFRLNLPALFYNKDIFDKFGVAYPKDGMTWEETEKLANALTRSDGGTQYLGVSVGNADRMAMGLSLPYVNKDASGAAMETAGWQRLLNLYKEIYSAPGYVKNGKLLNNFQRFYTEQTISMVSFWGLDMVDKIGDLPNKGQNFHFDLVTVPTFDKGKGVAWQTETNNLLISSTSKHKDQAFQAISYIAGEEVQKIFNKRGQITVLKKTEDIKKDFAAEAPLLQGKNTNAFFAYPPGLHDHTRFDQEGRNLAKAAADSTVIDGVDVNTALRNAQNEFDKYIQEDKAK